MQNFLPPENNAMSNLLAIVSDPKRAQARLKDLNDQQAAIQKALDEQRKAVEEARKEREEAEKTKLEVLALKDDMMNNLDAQQKHYATKLSDFDKMYTEYQANRNKEINELDIRKRDLDAKESSISQRENTVASKELAVTYKEKELEDLIKDYKAKVDYFKHIP